MAKEYFQDITPPGNTPVTTLPVRKMEPENTADISAPRSIRDISVARSRPRIDESPRPVRSEEPEEKGFGRVLLWSLAGLLTVALGVVGVFYFRPTTVTVIPRSHTVTFSDTARVTASPEGASGGLSYTLVRVDHEDTATVPSGAVKRVEERARGTITISNAYSATSVKLIQNTRFETASGLVYRIKDAVNVPGKTTAGPGTLSVVVTADQAGEKYNVPPSSFTLPGLKQNAEMYAGVTAKSANAFSGGFVGDKPSVDSAAADTARTQMRARLLEVARASFASTNQDVFVFPDLVAVSFESKPDTVVDGSARLTEVAHVTYPSFPKSQFATAVGNSVSADSEGSIVSFIPSSDFGVRLDGELGVFNGPISLILSGSGRLLWTVNPTEIAQALAGKPVALFQEIVKGIKSVQEARSPQPFWTSSFPSDQNRIKIVVTDPLAQ